MWKTPQRTETSGDIEDVWAVYTDVSLWPVWSKDILSASLEGPFAPGSEGHVKFSGLPQATYRIEAVEFPRNFRLTTRLALLGITFTSVHFDHRLTPVPEGRTRIEETATFTGFLAWLVGMIESRRIRRRWPVAMEAMTKLALERAAGAA